MKRIIFLIMTMAFVAIGCNKNLEQFTVTPTSLEFSGEAGSQTVTVTAGETWALKINGGGSWLTTSKTYGKSSGQVEVSVTANAPYNVFPVCDDIPKSVMCPVLPLNSFRFL